MKERMRFILDCDQGHYSVTDLCRMYDISRKTGYKWLDRFARKGPKGLEDESRAPHHHPLKVSEEIEQVIVAARGQWPKWGAPKLRDWLEGKYPDRHWPAASTFGAILKRYGLTVPQAKRRRVPPYTKPFVDCTGPNALWCADYKGWFRTGDGQRCEPLTISDAYSRYLIRCQTVPRTGFDFAWPIFQAAFIEYGLPLAIRTDNGPPFASKALAGLSRLSVLWIKLGIIPERIDPGKPQQNGRHERVHRTIKLEAASPPEQTVPKQQGAFDVYKHVYNHERPHDSLGGQSPAKHYGSSPRPYPLRIPEVQYEEDVTVRRVRSNGEIKWRGNKIFLTEVLIGEPVGLEQIDDRYWLVRFGPIELGRLDDHEKRIIQPSRKALASMRNSPKTQNVLPMYSV